MAYKLTAVNLGFNARVLELSVLLILKKQTKVTKVTTGASSETQLKREDYLQQKLIFQFVSLSVWCWCLVSFILLHFFYLSVDSPEITQGPESQSVTTGDDTTFTVEATGDKMEFQWQKNERNIDNESRFNFSRCADTSTLCIQHTEKSDKGHYRCLIKNPVEKKGKPSKTADLSVCKLVL